MVNDGEAQHIVYQSPESIDHLLSKELLQLSLRDRNAIDEEIHGVSTLALEENPHMLNVGLLELSEELENIPDESPVKVAYLESQTYPNTYVNGRDFRLKFLRCELFDAAKAAMRLCKFLILLEDIFGPEALVRPIQMSDFTRDEEKLFRKGNCQVLPFRDRSGRSIFAWVGEFGLQEGTPRMRIKILIYIYFSMVESLETQRKGILFLAWIRRCQSFALPEWENVTYMKKVMEGIPLRIVASHFCLPDDPKCRVLRTMYAITQSPSNRTRLNFHIGEEVELRYKLKTYGIPVDLIPVTGTGNIKLVYFKQWLRVRRYLEEVREKGDLEEAESIIECPRSTDVLFRTGTSLTCHPGNSMLQNMIEAKMQEHCNASQTAKMAITKDIVNAIKHKGGRFLQWNATGWWTELEVDTKIHRKVAVCIKSFKDKPVFQQKQQIVHSSTYLFKNQDGKRRKITHDSDDESGGSCCTFSVDVTADLMSSAPNKIISSSPNKIMSSYPSKMKVPKRMIEDIAPDTPSEIFSLPSSIFSVSR